MCNVTITTRAHATITTRAHLTITTRAHTCRRHAVARDAPARSGHRARLRTQRLVPQVPLCDKSSQHRDNVRLAHMVKRHDCVHGAGEASHHPLRDTADVDATGRSAYLLACYEDKVRVNNDVLAQLANGNELFLRSDAGARDVRPIAVAFAMSTHLTEVHLEDCDIGDTGGDAVVRALMGKPITSITLVRCGLRLRSALAIADLFRQDASSLQRLRLGKNPLTDRGVQALVHEAAVRNARLTHLNLSGTELGQRDDKSIGAIVALLTSHVRLVLQCCFPSATCISLLIGAIQHHNICMPMLMWTF